MQMNQSIDIPLATPVLRWLEEVKVFSCNSEYLFPARRLIHMKGGVPLRRRTGAEPQGALRFTQQEIDECRAIGIDVTCVRTLDGFAVAMRDCLDIVARARPELFDKITTVLLANDRDAGVP